MGDDEIRAGDGPGAAWRRSLIGTDRYRTFVLVTVLSGLFSVTITITILAVSIPRIAGDLGSDEAALTWIITGPLLALGVLSPAAGKAGDLFGHRRMFVIGNLVAACFALATSQAPTAGTVVAFRVLGAAAGSVTGPAAAALINRLYPRTERVRAMGWFSFVAAGAPVLGVVGGGPIVEHIGWRWIFVIQGPLLFTVAAAGFLVLPHLSTQRGVRFDVAGAATLGAGLTAVLYGLNRGPTDGWTSATVLACALAAPLLLACFVLVERRASSPLIPLEFFGRRNFAVPAVTSAMMNFAYMGGFIITPLLLAGELGYGETKVGLISIPRPIAFSLAGPIAGLVAVRLGERRVAVGGAVCLAGSLVLLSGVSASTPDTLIMTSLALGGMGMGSANPSMTASVANAVDDQHQGIAGATLQATQQLGTVAGIQLLETVQRAREPAVGAIDAFGEAYLLGAAVCALAAVGAAFIRSTDRSERIHDREAGLEASAIGGEGGRLSHGALSADD